VPPKPVSFETLHGGSAIRFLGSVYATAQNICDMTKEVAQGSGSERMGGYDQFISLLFCILQIIYVLYMHLYCFIYSKEFILSVLLPYDVLYLFVFNFTIMLFMFLFVYFQLFRQFTCLSYLYDLYNSYALCSHDPYCYGYI
jgi:hypothetical protein